MVLEKLRSSSQSVVVKIILGAIILSFALAGVGSYVTRPPSTAVVTVNGEEISAATLEGRLQQQRAQLKQQFGDFYDQIAGNEQYMAQMRQALLDELITQTLLKQHIHKLGIVVDHEMVKKQIRAIPAFHKNGVFDNDTYLMLLRQNNLTPESFSQLMRDQLAIQLFQEGVFQTEFSLPNEAERFSELYFQNRDISLVKIDPARFNTDVEVTDAAIQNYYEKNPNQFLEPEAVRVNYVKLDLETLSDGIQVTDEEAQTFYQEHLDQYATPEKRDAAQVFFAIDDNTTQEQALEQAQNALAELSQAADFATTAKAIAERAENISQLEDLGLIARGEVPAEFSDVLFAMDKVKDTALVTMQDGYYVIQMTALTKKQQKSFAEVKARIFAEQKLKKAQDAFYEQQSQLSDLVYENPSSLEMAASTLGLKIHSTDMFTKQLLPEPLRNAKLAQAAFDPTLRNDDINSEVIKPSETEAFALHVVDYQPEQVKALEKVQTEIEAMLRQQLTQEKAQDFAQTLMAKLSAEGADIATLVHDEKLKLESSLLNRFSQNTDADFVKNVYRMPKPNVDKPSWQVISLKSGELAIVRLNTVSVAEEQHVPLEQFSEVLVQIKREASHKAFLAELRRQAKVEMNNNTGNL